VASRVGWCIGQCLVKSRRGDGEQDDVDSEGECVVLKGAALLIKKWRTKIARPWIRLSLEQLGQIKISCKNRANMELPRPA
jgi:hypothetical protein